MFQKLKVKCFFLAGLIFLILALVGIVLPILPTTPFALLAIYFFSISSEKFHKWVVNLPGIKEGVYDWQKHKVIRMKAKVQATILIIFSAILVIYKTEVSVNLKAINLSILTIVLIFLLTRRTKP